MVHTIEGIHISLLRGMGIRPIIKPRANARTEVVDGP
jgi:hypothetical protein